MPSWTQAQELPKVVHIIKQNSQSNDWFEGTVRAAKLDFSLNDLGYLPFGVMKVFILMRIMNLLNLVSLMMLYITVHDNG